MVSNDDRLFEVVNSRDWRVFQISPQLVQEGVGQLLAVPRC
jgi:hypothetical protein